MFCPCTKILSLLLSVTALKTVAQAPLFSSFIAEAVHSSRHVLCFFQDHRGFVWTGTENGLNFYNGATLRRHKHNGADKTSLLNNRVQRICKDATANVWASTETGIAKLNPFTQRFTNYTTGDKGALLGYKGKAFSDKEGNVWRAAACRVRCRSWSFPCSRSSCGTHGLQTENSSP